MWNITYIHRITHGGTMKYTVTNNSHQIITDILKLLHNPIIGSHCFAFTLAEVLITLAIIGIVAAMTIPALVTKYNNLILETAFKKSYSNLSQVMSMLSFEFTNPSITSTDDNNELYHFLYEHLQIIQDPSDPEDPYAASRFWITMGYLNKDNSPKILTYNKSTMSTIPQCPKLPVKHLSDGSIIGGLYNCYSYWIVMDTNGRKGPNAFGHDIFYFGYDGETKRLKPLGDGAYGFWNFADSQYCSKNSTNEQNGLGCANWAVKNKCPDDDSKTYWECLP